VLDYARSGPRTGCTKGKLDLPIRRRRAVEAILFGALLRHGRKRLSLGKDEGKRVEIGGCT